MHVHLRTYPASHFLNIDLIKSKKIVCSNWEKEILSSQQLKYAAYVLIHSLVRTLTRLYKYSFTLTQDALISKLIFDKALEASQQQSKSKARGRAKKEEFVEDAAAIKTKLIEEGRNSINQETSALAMQEDQVYVSYV